MNLQRIFLEVYNYIKRKGEKEGSKERKWLRSHRTLSMASEGEAASTVSQPPGAAGAGRSVLV